MTFVLLTLQVLGLLSPRPQTAAYAQQVKNDVVVSVTYTLEKPNVVCISTHRLDDPEFNQPTSTVCVDDIDTVGNNVVLSGERLDMMNFVVVVRYPSGKGDILYLVQKVNT